MYVYRRTTSIQTDAQTRWTVGYWQPNGHWAPESDHSTQESAAQRVRWLNGGYLDHNDSPRLVSRDEPPDLDHK